MKANFTSAPPGQKVPRQLINRYSWVPLGGWPQRREGAEPVGCVQMAALTSEGGRHPVHAGHEETERPGKGKSALSAEAEASTSWPWSLALLVLRGRTQTGLRPLGLGFSGLQVQGKFAPPHFWVPQLAEGRLCDFSASVTM